MIVTLREMFGAGFRFWDDHISSEGAWWILALNSVFFIPLIFAVFFFPVAVLGCVAALALLVVAFIGLRRVVHPRQ